MMKKLILFWIIIITAVSCTTVPEPEITVDLQSEVTQYQDRIDGLRQQNYAYHMKVDSLYEEILTLKDSLAFLGSTTRIKKQIDFPDTLYYAGYAFDLTNDRIFQKFYYWYRAEIKFAYKYIPRTTKYFLLLKTFFLNTVLMMI